jgi:serine/threonine protein kinase
LNDGRWKSAECELRVIGQRVNNYEVKRLLGEGGMGAVYVAEHPVLGRRVAVKVLRRELVQDEKLVARFLNEARAADAIRHPNIVQVQDVGLLSDGLPYIVMELLEGQTLGARITAAGRLGVAETLALSGQAAAAIAAAHQVGIVHRDLKPDNLFLVLDDAAPARQRVKVLDFGIAKLRVELGGSDLRTKTGAVMGTPTYMSPEQCLGRSAEVDHRTDVYALGVIMFEMLCGVPPFVGEGFGEVLVMHMTQPPPSPRALNPEITPSVEQLLLCALAKRKEDRFATMQEMAEAIAIAARDPNVRFGADGRGNTLAPQGTGPMTPAVRTPTPVRPTTTLSAATGAVEPGLSSTQSSGSMAELRPARSRRLGVIAGGLVVAAGAAGLFVWSGQQATAPVEASGGVAEVSRAAITGPTAAVAAPGATGSALVENAATVQPPPAAGKLPAEKADKAEKAEKAEKKSDKAEKSDKPADKSGKGDKTKPEGGRKVKPAKRDKEAPAETTGRGLARPHDPDVLTPFHELPAPPAAVTPPPPPAPPKPERLEKL